MRTRRRARGDHAMDVPQSLDNAHVPVVKRKTSARISRLQDSNEGQTSEALQLTNICSLSQGSDHYNSSIALLLDWGKSTSEDPVSEQTSVTCKDPEQICPVDSEDSFVLSDSISTISLGPNVDATEVAAKSQPSFSEVVGDQTHGDVLPENSEKEEPESITEDVFCCILGWLARSTGKSLCSCKKDQYTMPTLDSLSDFSVKSISSNNSCSKQPEISSLVPENGATSQSSALEVPKVQTNQANLSADGPEDLTKSVTESNKKCDVSTPPGQLAPKVISNPGDVMVQKPEDKNKNAPKKVLEIKTESEVEESAPSKDLVSLKVKESTCDVGRSSSSKDPPVINQPDPPSSSAHASEAKNVNMPLKNVLNIKKEKDLEESCKQPDSLSDTKMKRKRGDPSAGLVPASEAKTINQPKEGPLNIKKESDLQESATGKETNNVFCCILSWLAQGTGKQVQCSCASEGKTEPSVLTSEADSVLKGSSGPDTGRRLSRRNGSKLKCGFGKCLEDHQKGSIPKCGFGKCLEDHQKGSIPKCGFGKCLEDHQKGKLAEQLTKPPQLTWQSLFGPQPETSGNCTRGKKRKRNASISEPALSTEPAPQPSRSPPLTWLSLLGLQRKMGANAKGKQKGKALPDEGLMGLAQSQMQGRWPPVTTPSKERPDASVVPSKKLKSEILNIIKAKTTSANGNTDQNGSKRRSRLDACATKNAGKLSKNAGASSSTTKQKGGKQQSGLVAGKWQNGLAAGTTQRAKKGSAKVDGSEQKSGKGKTKLAAGTGKRTEKKGGSKQKVVKPGKPSAGTVKQTGKRTGNLAGKSGLKLVSRTGSSASSKSKPEATSTVQSQTHSEQKRRRPVPKKGSRRKIILLEPNTEVVQQTVDITLNYLSQIFFLEKLF